MGKQWDAEHEVDAALAKRLIDSQFPELSPASIEFVGNGWDNTVFRVNADFTFRFPRRKLGVECMINELRVMPHVGNRLPIPISAPIYEGKPSETFDAPFAGYRWLPGRVASYANMSDEQYDANAGRLGVFLRELHAIGKEEAKRFGAEPDAIRRFDLPYRRAQLTERLNEIESLNIIDDLSPWRRLVERIEPLREARQQCLVHGDLYAHQVLVDEQGNITGIIDWGDVHLGDPAVDLAAGFMLFSPAARQRFIDAYGGADADTLNLARFRALYHTAATVTYAHDVNDAPLLEELLRALRLIACD